MRQTNRIRRSVEKWLTDTDIMNIRQRLPHREIAPLGASQEEQEAIEARNAKARTKQMKENFTAIMDAIMETHANETLEILALCCFVEPEEIDNYTVAEYLRAFNELMNDEDITSFFTSLLQWGQRAMQNA